MKKLQLRHVEGDLTELDVDAIVNPANSLGVMGGGVAGVIRSRGGTEIEREARKRAPIPIGKAVLTSAGKLPCRFVIHAPTMEQPAQATSLENVKKATLSALECAEEAGLKRIAFPGMGTGVGRVPPNQAARVMVETVGAFAAKSVEEVVFVSFGKDMKSAFEAALYKNALDV